MPISQEQKKESLVKNWTKGRRGFLQQKTAEMITPEGKDSMLGAGYFCKGKRFVTHSTLNWRSSALHTLAPRQKVFLSLAGVVAVSGFIVAPLATAALLVAVLSALYFADFIFSVFIVARSLSRTPEIAVSNTELEELGDSSLPVYTILCPLYKEAAVLENFVRSIERIQWPKDKLEVLLLLEEDDLETIETAQKLLLPSHIRTVIVPDSQPKTKPKACNYGLNLARGEYVVIFDAEDQPDPIQLKKAYLTFQKVPSKVKCLQAKLNYYNPHQNLLTRLFTTEYSLWFDVLLPGLQSIDTIIPLGGTSNHFRRRDLLELEGWDPFNVTEDCDLGTRLFARGGRTAIIDSTTLEEANSNLGNWMRQRSRWIKGYIQTYLVHMRRPLKLVKCTGIHAFLFQLVIGLKIGFILINPFLWIATILYFASSAVAGPFIETLYGTGVLYLAGASMVFGNFFFFYSYMIGCVRRGHWSLVKFVFLIPFYWVFISAAAGISLYQLVVKPHFWEKTRHGLHLRKKKTRIWERDQISGILFPQAGYATWSASIGLRAAVTRLKKHTRELGKAVRSAVAVVKITASFYSQKRETTRRILRARIGTIGIAAKRVAGSFSSVVNKFLDYFWNQLVPDTWTKKIVSGAGILVSAVLVSHFVNFVFNAYLGRVLSFEELGLVVFINTLWYVATIFLGAFSSTVNHKSAFLSSKRGESASVDFLRLAVKRGIIAALVVTLGWMLAVPFLARFFNIADAGTLILFAPSFAFGLIMTAHRGFLRGTLRFKLAAALTLAEAAIKFIAVVLLVEIGLSTWAYAAIPFSIIAVALAAWWVVRRATTPHAGEEHQSFPFQFYGASVMTSISAVMFLSLDVLLVKHFLPAQEAGEYALLSLVGKMIYFFGALPTMFMLTLVSRDEGIGHGSRGTFRVLFGMTALLSAVGVLFLGPLGSVTAPILFGEKALAVVPLLNFYAVAIAFFTLSNAIVLFHLARKRYMFPVAALLQSVGMTLGMAFYHETIDDIVGVIFITSSIGMAVLAEMHLLDKEIRIVGRNLLDIIEAFVPLRRRRKMEGVASSILIFNWRDKRHKFAGGAEAYVHEMARRWAQQGKQVTVFCGNDNLSPRYEVIDKVEIFRCGGFYFVYIWAFLYYMLRFRGKYDVIIDCQNGIPFFTPLYVREPVYCLMHHVHQEIFRRSLAAPLAALARFLERDVMPLVYRNVKFVTVSESSKKEMEALGIGQAGVNVVHPGVDLAKYETGEKSKNPTLLYLGRLKEYKSIDVLLKAFTRIAEKLPKAHLVIAGSGEEERPLKQLATALGLNAQVTFVGHVTEKEKVALMQKAWMFVNPSFMEGWGITTIEANACGTPVVASDVPGLRDSVRNPHTGLLVEYGNENAFSAAAAVLIENEGLRYEMGKAAARWAQRFNWDAQSKKLAEIIENK